MKDHMYLIVTVSNDTRTFLFEWFHLFHLFLSYPTTRVVMEKWNHKHLITLTDLCEPTPAVNQMEQHCSPCLSCTAHCPLWCTTNWDWDCDLAARSSLCPEAYTFVLSFIYWFIWIASLLWTLDTFLFSFCLALKQSRVIFLPSGSSPFCDSFSVLQFRVKIIITICYAKESFS